MDATLSSSSRVPARRTGLIVIAVLAAAALAAGAMLFEPPERGALSPPAVSAASGGPVSASTGGDPSLPSAAAVLRDRGTAPEEPALTF